jgi:multiple sugar transport system ATP-binding protein
MVTQPKVFLFDEPLCNLDTKMRVQMRTEIVKLHQRLQATMIYVTHDHAEAMTMGSRIVVMDAVANQETGPKEGVVQQMDSPLKLYNEPANTFVAGFLGSPPMNFLKGTLRRDGSNMIFKESKGGVVELNLGQEQPATLAYLGKEILLGVRPEHCGFLPLGKTPSRQAFQAVAEVIEPLGSETYFHLQTGAHMLTGRSTVPIDQSESGHRISFEIDAERTHLFDPCSGSRIH